MIHPSYLKITAFTFIESLKSFTYDRKNSPVANVRIKSAILNPIKTVGHALECAAVAPVWPIFLNTPIRIGKLIDEHISGERLNPFPYVRISGFGKYKGFDYLAGDWLSLINGMIDYTLDAIKGKDADEILRLDVTDLALAYYAFKYLSLFPGTSLNKAKSPSKRDAKNWIASAGIIVSKNNKKQIEDFIFRMLDMRSLVQSSNQKWNANRQLTFTKKAKIFESYVRDLADTLI